MKYIACALLCVSFLTIHPVYGQVLYANIGLITIDWNDQMIPLVNISADILTGSI